MSLISHTVQISMCILIFIANLLLYSQPLTSGTTPHALMWPSMRKVWTGLVYGHVLCMSVWGTVGKTDVLKRPVEFTVEGCRLYKRPEEHTQICVPTSHKRLSLPNTENQTRTSHALPPTCSLCIWLCFCVCIRVCSNCSRLCHYSCSHPDTHAPHLGCCWRRAAAPIRGGSRRASQFFTAWGFPLVL